MNPIPKLPPTHTHTASLKRLARQGCQMYLEEPRAEWVLKQPAQLVIAVSQIYWCANVEERLRSADPSQGLEAFLGVSRRVHDKILTVIPDGEGPWERRWGGRRGR